MSRKKAKIIPYDTNSHHGCLVNCNFNQSIEEFTIDLNFSLQYWKSLEFKVAWLTIPERNSHLISPSIGCGFKFHHIDTYESTIVLTIRLINNAIIPDFANHTIGVGGIVLNDLNQILVVVEKHDMLKRPGHFKFPGGAVDKGEMLSEAVIREVREETGIESTFNGVIGFRHNHCGQFGTSNIYFLCHLTAKGHDINRCDVEIGFANWMDIDEYLSTDTVIDFNKSMLKAALKYNYLELVSLGDVAGVSCKDYEILLPSNR